MRYKQLRNRLHNKGPRLIRWTRSGIIEYAEVTDTGAVKITNLTSRKTYTIPKRYEELNVEWVEESHVRLGDLLPKAKP